MKNDNLKLKNLIIFSIIFFGALFFAKASLAAVTLPWSTTFNCADWTQSATISCDSMTVACDTCYCTTGGPSMGSSVSASYNNPLGSGKGWRFYTGDGRNMGSAKPYISLSVEPEIWVRYYIRWQAGFKWANGNPQWMKMLYTHGPPPMNSVAFNLVEWGGCTGSGFRLINPAPVACLPYSWSQLFAATGGVSDGQFHCFEFHLKTGATTGVFEVWVDGTLVGSANNIKVVEISGMTEFRVNQNDPINGVCYWEDIDDIKISNTGYIGPLNSPSDTTPPVAPTGVTVS